MSAFMESQAALFAERNQAELPQIQHWRQQAMAQAERVGFPGNTREGWKHSPLRALASKRFGARRMAANANISNLPPAPRLVFLDGRYSAADSDTGTLPGVHIQQLADVLQGGDLRAAALLGREFPDNEAPFASLNTALAEDGVLIDIDSGIRMDSPLHVVFLHSSDLAEATYARHRITCAEDSQLTLIEHHRGGGSGVSNTLWHVHLKPRASLTHIRLQDNASTLTSFSRCDAAVAGSAEYTRLDIDTGSHFARHELNLALQGRNAKVRSGGVLWADGNSTLDTRVCARHQAPDTECRLIWRGLADAKARANFFGGIVIDAGADGSNAALSNKNLLLSGQAQINTQPALEIHADEVKAAHGATVGQLDGTALFYLRSRGVSQAQAQQMLTRAFYAEAFEVLDDANLRDTLLAYLPAHVNPGSAE